MMCIYQKYPKCYILLLRRKDNDYCTAAPETIKCMKEDAAKCQSEEPKVIADLETVMHDVCERGTQLNRGTQMKCLSVPLGRLVKGVGKKPMISTTSFISMDTSLCSRLAPKIQLLLSIFHG
ncbi:hypothetical protein JTE90_000437 [Oedothorax gibbosus]|uniref:Uncharacterized protein n=1 Tax=Oedothorax gibbosus TaxID=931172 RepID=A0AAV6UFG2_9ARAC|nr:hypothetical protein JTE90_000437 [Oedothorax gibbosus]